MADSQRKTPNVMTSASAQVQRANGITISCDGNGRYTINGTATADSTIYFDIPEFITPKSAQQGGNGTFRFFNPVIGSNSGDSRIYFYAGTTAVENYQLTIADRQSTTYGGSLAFQRINKISFFIRSGVTVANAVVTPMFTDDGTIPIIYQPYSATGWVHSLRKLTTATEAIQSGDTIYANGQPITTYTLKGNTVPSVTPAPSNPVEVNGVGERTENVYNKYNVIQVSNLGTRYGSYVDKGVYSIYNDTDNDVYWGGNGFQSRYLACSPHSTATVDMTSFSYSDYGFIMPYNDASLGDITIVQGSTVPDHYEPYGYEIPISSGQQTIDIYIGDLPLLKSLDGTAVDEISNGTLTRRVDADGSVLPTPTTTQITMPSISTTDGANSITVDTTVQPSEFTATWTGWHDSSVKEWDGSDWR